ncbi:MAG: hypothetical protein Q9169_004048 [Polycauliona sp. 2 TL-2023]
MRNVVRYHQFLASSTRLRTWPGIYSHPWTSCPLHRPWLGPRTVIPVRGAKSKTTVRQEDLPQGALEPMPDMAEEEDQGPTYPTVIRQARSNMTKFDNCVVLTRVGSFYEAGFPFFQLDRFLKILVQDLSKYVAISEEFANDPSNKVKSGGLMFDRRVTRIVTPGTLIDEKFMDPDANNFLLAVHPLGQNNSPHIAEDQIQKPRSAATDSPLNCVPVGLAWLDLSTGDFFTQSTSLSTLPSAFARIGAKEVIVSDGLDQSIRQAVSSMVEYDRRLLTYHAAHNAELPISTWAPMLESPAFSADEAAFTPDEISAGSMLLSYVVHRLQGLKVKVQTPQRRRDFETMNIDKTSLRGLEVLATSKEGIVGGKGSLLHTVRRTVTRSGSRLLKDWISSPSASLPVIDERLDLVSMLLHDAPLREEIVRDLRRSSDCPRLVQRFSLGRGDADDLVSLLRTIETTQSIADVLERSNLSEASETNGLEVRQPLQRLSRRLSLEDPRALALRISSAIDEDGLLKNHRREESESARYISAAHDVLHSEGAVADFDDMPRAVRVKGTQQSISEHEIDDEDDWVMRKRASPVLQGLHDELIKLRQQRERLTGILKEQIGASSLTLRYVAGSGHVCHVKGSKDVRHTGKVALGGRSGRSTKSTRTFYNSDWTELGAKMDMIKFQIRAEEQQVLHELREQVVANLVKLRRNAAVLDELDIGCAFATLAEEQGFTRPVLNQSRKHKIVGGRHPAVKSGLEEGGKAFVENDCFLGEEERVWLITGPNMGGKSTFLRQNALISILAQAGCFVPANHAELGLVDQIFSRVGSADDLFREQSTFMVEMLETAMILSQATSRSFVIMDEIGRGTTPKDGVAIAFACLHHLHHHNQCRTLFATHFHVLADLAKDFDHLACYCADVAEGADGSFSYIHRLRRGVNRASHALKVARLAAISKDSTIYIDGGKQSFIDVDADGKQIGNVTVGLTKDQNRSFWLNGQVDSGSSSQSTNLDSSTSIFQKGMIVINHDDHTAMNISTDAIVGDRPRARGRTQWCVGLGTNGLLVLIGGNQKHVSDTVDRGVGDLVPMDRVHIFDVSSIHDDRVSTGGTWYEQPVTGDIPERRVDFCITKASAVDLSSINIATEDVANRWSYMYGGLGANGAIFDDIYVLSMPSFSELTRYLKACTYTLADGRKHGPKYIRATVDAMVIPAIELVEEKSSQLVVRQQRTYRWEVATSEPKESMLTWSSMYNMSQEDYFVPSAVVARIGGNDLVSPPSAASQPRTPAPATDEHSNATKSAIIAGAVVGGSVLLGLSIAAAWIFRDILQRMLIGELGGRLEMDGNGKTMSELPGKGACWELPGNEVAELWSPTATTSPASSTETEGFRHETRSDRELGWRGEIECEGDGVGDSSPHTGWTGEEYIRFLAIVGASQPFDPSHRYTTSWILPPFLLAACRLISAIYIFTTIFFIFGWNGAHRRPELSRHSFSFFTNLGYWGLGFYFLFSSLHTFSYARTGKSWLQKWPAALQVAHTVFYTTVVTFPILVTAVFWAILYNGTWFPTEFEGWSNTSQHALNTVFAAFEILATRTSPPPPAHLPFLVILLALYLALAYLTHVTAGFYPYSFLDPDKGSGKLAGYILGILAAACVIFGIVWGIIWVRRWLTESKLSMRGKLSKHTVPRDEEMMEMTGGCKT